MPCRSDYMEASGRELESQRVCKCLAYIYQKTGQKVPGWVTRAASNYYGNLERLDEATSRLCEACRLLSEADKDKIIYNGRSKKARRLADWWDRHVEWDNRRIAEEEKSRKKIMLKDRALKKLSVEERKALGL